MDTESQNPPEPAPDTSQKVDAVMSRMKTHVLTSPHDPNSPEKVLARVKNQTFRGDVDAEPEPEPKPEPVTESEPEPKPTVNAELAKAKIKNSIFSAKFDAMESSNSDDSKPIEERIVPTEFTIVREREHNLVTENDGENPNRINDAEYEPLQDLPPEDNISAKNSRPSTMEHTRRHIGTASTDGEKRLLTTATSELIRELENYPYLLEDRDQQISELKSHVFDLETCLKDTTEKLSKISKEHKMQGKLLIEKTGIAREREKELDEVLSELEVVHDDNKALGVALDAREQQVVELEDEINNLKLKFISQTADENGRVESPQRPQTAKAASRGNVFRGGLHRPGDGEDGEDGFKLFSEMQKKKNREQEVKEAALETLASFGDLIGDSQWIIFIKQVLNNESEKPRPHLEKFRNRVMSYTKQLTKRIEGLESELKCEQYETERRNAITEKIRTELTEMKQNLPDPADMELKRANTELFEKFLKTSVSCLETRIAQVKTRFEDQFDQIENCALLRGELEELTNTKKKMWHERIEQISDLGKRTDILEFVEGHDKEVDDKKRILFQCLQDLGDEWDRCQIHLSSISNIHDEHLALSGDGQLFELTLHHVEGVTDVHSKLQCLMFEYNQTRTSLESLFTLIESAIREMMFEDQLETAHRTLAENMSAELDAKLGGYQSMVNEMTDDNDRRMRANEDAQLQLQIIHNENEQLMRDKRRLQAENSGQVALQMHLSVLVKQNDAFRERCKTLESKVSDLTQQIENCLPSPTEEETTHDTEILELESDQSEDDDAEEDEFEEQTLPLEDEQREEEEEEPRTNEETTTSLDSPPVWNSSAPQVFVNGNSNASTSQLSLVSHLLSDMEKETKNVMTVLSQTVSPARTSLPLISPSDKGSRTQWSDLDKENGDHDVSDVEDESGDTELESTLKKLEAAESAHDRVIDKYCASRAPVQKELADKLHKKTLQLSSLNERIVELERQSYLSKQKIDRVRSIARSELKSLDRQIRKTKKRQDAEKSNSMDMNTHLPRKKPHLKSPNRRDLATNMSDRRQRMQDKFEHDVKLLRKQGPSKAKLKHLKSKRFQLAATIKTLADKLAAFDKGTKKHLKHLRRVKENKCEAMRRQVDKIQMRRRVSGSARRRLEHTFPPSMSGAGVPVDVNEIYSSLQHVLESEQKVRGVLQSISPKVFVNDQDDRPATAPDV